MSDKKYCSCRNCTAIRRLGVDTMATFGNRPSLYLAAHIYAMVERQAALNGVEGGTVDCEGAYKLIKEEWEAALTAERAFATDMAYEYLAQKDDDDATHDK